MEPMPRRPKGAPFGARYDPAVRVDSTVLVGPDRRDGGGYGMAHQAPYSPHEVEAKVNPAGITFVHSMNHLPDPRTHRGDRVFVIHPKSAEYLVLEKRYVFYDMPGSNTLFPLVGWAWAHEAE